MTPERLKQIADETDINFGPYYDMLPELIKERDYKVGIEIGVYTAGHAESILDKTELKVLYGVDPYKYYDNGMPEFDSQEDYDRLREFAVTRLMLHGDRMRWFMMNSDDAFTKIINRYPIPTAHFDFVFIDGLHTQEQVEKDLDNYSQLVKPGGIVSGHDIDHGSFPGVTVAIEAFAKKHGKEIIRGPFHAWYINW